MKSIRKCIAANIRRLRKEKGWTQEQLAKKVGCPATSISRLEQGESATEKRIQKIAGALGADISELYAGITPDMAKGTVTTEEMLLLKGYRKLPDNMKSAVTSLIRSAAAIHSLDAKEVEIAQKFRNLDTKTREIVEILCTQGSLRVEQREQLKRLEAGASRARKR